MISDDPRHQDFAWAIDDVRSPVKVGSLGLTVRLRQIF